MASDMISYFVLPFIEDKRSVTELDVVDALYNQGFNLRAPSERHHTQGLLSVPFWRQRLVWRQFDYIRDRLKGNQWQMES